ncbi:DMT family transporter [Roseovarius atlanticus]|uniref:DMT family transporter n=1 Tax=Roseovarius atlanticus TaxID=1641875 RepID=UPI001C986AAF|nr:DMT family transporter [Roseovarius atlanticus]MBY5986412.1 DMT family transporter [Roseovarius atlanticus]MBY6125052.1 DMT family transporter [Roseovarius atlanticus]MBY6150487.1 DMT family transporter [Roseovarius atlanticus]
MRLFLLTALTMVAFAANSILNRLALARGHIDAVPFGAIRLVAGAAMLAGLCIVLRGGLRLGGPARVAGVVSLLVYMYGFSLAYTALDAGLGALILFGMVQITMFAAALLTHESLPARRWIGAGLALAGLAWLMWPGAGTPVSPAHGALMALAGIGWGVYSLAGRKSKDALQATAANFTLAAPFGLLAWLALPSPADAAPLTTYGILLAVFTGAVTSGLGYALWYTVLPSLAASVAAVAQLTVPIIALLGGIVLLNESLTVQIVLSSALVLGGVALSMPRRRKT